MAPWFWSTDPVPELGHRGPAAEKHGAEGAAGDDGHRRPQREQPH